MDDDPFNSSDLEELLEPKPLGRHHYADKQSLQEMLDKVFELRKSSKIAAHNANYSGASPGEEYIRSLWNNHLVFYRQNILRTFLP